VHLGGELLDVALGVQRPVEIKPALFRLGEFELRSSLMCWPMAVGLRKSIGVPLTGASSPVGIKVAFTGV
jgi:hypothetical protein